MEFNVKKKSMTGIYPKEIKLRLWSGPYVWGAGGYIFVLKKNPEVPRTISLLCTCQCHHNPKV
jgi:hypothetical protein